MNSEMWNSGIESNKQIARNRKRKLNYISNIYVVSDPANPENNGHIFLFKYGKKIFDKIYEAMNPQFEDEESFDPFNFWTGANLKLKVQNVDDYRNYDKSVFESPKPLSNDDGVLEKIWKSEYSLLELVDPSNFKDEVKLKARLDRVLGNSSGSENSASSNSTRTPETRMAQSSNNFDDDVPFDEDDPDLNYFKSLID
jgi:hypothetical protein